jgi:hypothetical protein
LSVAQSLLFVRYLPAGITDPGYGYASLLIYSCSLAKADFELANVSPICVFCCHRFFCFSKSAGVTDLGYTRARRTG